MSHVLHLGDGIAGMAAMPDRSASACVMDPPYSERVHARLGKEGRSDGIRPRSPLTFAALSERTATDAAAQVARVVTRWIVVFCDELSFGVWVAALESAGCEYVRKGTWVKEDQMPQMSGDRPSPGTEEMVIAHAPRPTGVRLRWSGGGKPAVYRGNAQEQSVARVHPAQKPLWLLKALLRDFTDPGDLVVDPFAGAASLLVAAKQIGRRAAGWEIDPGFYEVGRKRLDAAREQFQLPRLAKPRQLPLRGPGKDEEGAA